MRTTDGGNTWISSSVPTSFSSSSFREIYMLNTKVGWLVGAYDFPAFVAKTTNGGITWENQTPQGVNTGFESISMIDSSHGFLVGEGFYETFDGGLTNIDGRNISLIINYNLSQNYPNPFNPTTTIQYSIPKELYVIIQVYDILGKEIATLVNERKLTGNYSIDLKLRNLPSGIYFYRMRAGEFSETKK